MPNTLSLSLYPHTILVAAQFELRSQTGPPLHRQPAPGRAQQRALHLLYVPRRQAGGLAGDTGLGPSGGPPKAETSLDFVPQSLRDSPGQEMVADVGVPVCVTHTESMTTS